MEILFWLRIIITDDENLILITNNHRRMIEIFFSLPIIIIDNENCCSGHIQLLSIVVNITDESYSLSSSFLFCISNLNVRYRQSERKKKKFFYLS